MLEWIRNEVDFRLRMALRLRRPGARLPAEPKAGLFEAGLQGEVQRLVHTYGLERWEQESGRIDFAASLFYLQMLERALTEAGVDLPADLTALDAGCGDWFYVQALHGLLRRFGGERRVALSGVEVDAYRPYAGFRSRMDWAEAYITGLPGVQYLPCDIRRYLQLAALLTHIYGLVVAGGTLVIANLGDAEREEQQRLLAAAGLTPAWWGRHQSGLFAYRQPRYVMVVRKA